MYSLVGIFLVITWYIARTAYQMRSRRKREPGFAYVHVNLDGSVRELSPKEQDYLSQTFEPFDGGAPYIKISYEERDGLGRLSGFIVRRQVPYKIEVYPVNPLYGFQYSEEASKGTFDDFADQRIADTVSASERFEVFRRLRLARDLRCEEIASHPDYNPTKTN